MRQLSSLTRVAGLVLVIAGAAPCPAAVCTVPSAPYSTIQEAVDDLSCTEIVLAAGTFVEAVGIDRDLEVGGASSATTVIEGRVVIDGTGTDVEIHELTIDANAPSVAGCYSDALLSRGGAQIRAHDVAVVNGDGDACVIFRDGFETGNISAWSATSP